MTKKELTPPPVDEKKADPFYGLSQSNAKSGKQGNNEDWVVSAPHGSDPIAPKQQNVEMQNINMTNRSSRLLPPI